MGVTAEQVNSKTVSEIVNISVSFVGKLDEGEKLTGVPTVDAVAGLTFSAAVVSTEILTINKKRVPAGEAIQFSELGGSTVGSHTIPVACSTDSVPPQLRRGKLLLVVESDG